MTYSEDPNCNAGTPIISDVACPPAATAPVLRNAPTTLVMGSTTYNGTLRVDWEDRINRNNRLLTTIIRLILAFQDSASWLRSRTFRFRNPYNVSGRSDDRAVSLRGFPFLVASLDALHEKIDNLHDDLPRIEAVASIVEHWQLKREAMRPMVIFLFGELSNSGDKIGSGKWQISVPYANFPATSVFTNNFGFRHGKWQVLHTLADNSKIIFYCADPAEGRQLLNTLLAYVDPAQRVGEYTKIGEYTGPEFKDVVLRLRRIDWYEEGVLRNKPTAYRQLPNVPMV